MKSEILALASALSRWPRVEMRWAPPPPFLVLLGYAVAPVPMDLAFGAGLVRAALLSVLTLGKAAGDGHSNWLKDVQPFAVYLILELAFLLAPAAAER